MTHMKEFLKFLQKFDSSNKTVGKYEVSSNDLVDSVLQLLQKVCSTPTTLVSNTSSAVTVTQTSKGKYLITLNSFNPPIEIEWSDTMPMWQFNQVLNDVIENNKKIGFINKRRLSDGMEVFQLGLGNK